MERMLDGYLAFARGEEGEQAVQSDLSEIAREAMSPPPRAQQAGAGRARASARCACASSP
jgi:hypothetical protein